MKNNAFFIFFIFIFFLGRYLILFAGDQISVPLNSMIELDGLTKQEVFNLRRQYVSEHSELMGSSFYEPSSDVFGQIVDGKPWWGILGLSYFGSGGKSIDGPSEETRFLVNPFLLVGLNDPNAYSVSDSTLQAQAIYPEPENLIWDTDNHSARITYKVSEYLDKAQQYRYANFNNRRFDLIAYNARDLGFQYMYISYENSLNILPSRSKSYEAFAIQQFIHCGGSCGYPGGCNNMSPDQPVLDIKVQALPARVLVLLWKQKPFAINQAPDMSFVIDII